MLLRRIGRWVRSTPASIGRLNQDVRTRISQNSLARNRVLLLLWGSVRDLGQAEAGMLAASMAFYAMFSIFPLALGLISLLGFFAGSQTVQQQIFDFLATYFPGSDDLIRRNIDSVLRVRGALGLISVLGLLWSSSGVFGSINRAINRCWKVQRGRPFYVGRALQLAMTLGVLGLVLASMVLTSAVSMAGAMRLPFLANIAAISLILSLISSYLLPFLVTFTAFILVYKVMPSCTTHWRYIWPGAVASALLFEILKYAFVWYIGTITDYALVYGNLASVIVLLFWIYLASFILILGATISYQSQTIFSQDTAICE